MQLYPIPSEVLEKPLRFLLSHRQRPGADELKLFGFINTVIPHILSKLLFVFFSIFLGRVMLVARTDHVTRTHPFSCLKYQSPNIFRPVLNFTVEIDMDMDIHGYPQIFIPSVDMDGYG